MKNEIMKRELNKAKIKLDYDYETLQKYNEINEKVKGSSDITKEELEILDKVEIYLSGKFQDVANFYSEVIAEQERIKGLKNILDSEVKRLREQLKGLEEKENLLKNYTKEVLQLSGVEKVGTTVGDVSIRRTKEVVVIEDEEDFYRRDNDGEFINKEFIRVKYEPDKNAIHKHYHNHHLIPSGVSIKDNVSIHIPKVNKD